MIERDTASKKLLRSLGTGCRHDGDTAGRVLRTTKQLFGHQEKVAE